MKINKYFAFLLSSFILISFFVVIANDVISSIKSVYYFEGNRENITMPFIYDNKTKYLELTAEYPTLSVYYQCFNVDVFNNTENISSEFEFFNSDCSLTLQNVIFNNTDLTVFYTAKGFYTELTTFDILARSLIRISVFVLIGVILYSLYKLFVMGL